MAVDITLKMNDISGDSTVTGHEGEVTVLAWSWGQSRGYETDSGRLTGKPDCVPISFTKYFDKGSSAMLNALVNGTKLEGFKLTVRGAALDGTQEDQATIELVNPRAVSMTTGGSGGESRLTENWTVIFDEMTYDNLEEGTTFNYNWRTQVL